MDRTEFQQTFFFGGGGRGVFRGLSPRSFENTGHTPTIEGECFRSFAFGQSPLSPPEFSDPILPPLRGGHTETNLFFDARQFLTLLNILTFLLKVATQEVLILMHIYGTSL